MSPSPTTAPDVSAPARPPLSRHLVILGIVLALVALDLWSKSAAFAHFERLATDAAYETALVADDVVVIEEGTGKRRHLLLGKWLALMTNLNYGAAFGQGGDWPYVLVIGRCIAVLVLSVLIVRTPRGQGLYLAALVLILSGALGNLWDNFFYDRGNVMDHRPFGPVRDFIDVYFGVWDWHFPTFNIADSCITVGAVLLILTSFIGGAEAPASEATRDRASGVPSGDATA